MPLEDFYKRLNLEVKFAPIEPRHLDKVGALTEQVSAFNLTAVQHSASELDVLIASGETECWQVQVQDRFGDYGLAGVVIFDVKADKLVVSTFLLNCRVLGKRVEHHVLGHLAQIARQRKIAQVSLCYRSTSKNLLAGEFVNQLSLQGAARSADGSGISLSVERIESLVLETLSPTRGALAAEARPTAGLDFLAARWSALDPRAKSALVTQIALEFQSGSHILEIVRQKNQRARPLLKDAFVEPRTPTEAQLVQMWIELLDLEKVGIQDNFFDLGGHSLQITQLVFRISDRFGVELPLGVLVQNPTVANMAQIIETTQQQGRTVAVQAASLDLAAEAVLDLAISVEAAAAAPAGEPAHVFLTGVTGFVGAFLLHELLQQTQATIHCLVRGVSDEAEGKKRIQKNLERYSIWQDSYLSRIIPVMGELSQPNLGLSERRFQALAEQVDVIYHSGAVTQFVYPYSELKPSNVQGTREVLRLASRAKIKPVHHVSTLYVFSYLDMAQTIYEHDIPEHAEVLVIGYMQSKWVAERLIMAARSKGVPASIYRLGRVSGHSRTGACRADDFAWQLIKAGVELGSVPAIDLILDMTPVDYVSRAIVHLSRQPDALGQVFHLVNSAPPRLGEVADWMRAFGYPLKTLGYGQWRDQLVEAATRSPQSTAAALIPFLPEEGARMHMGDGTFDCRHTLGALASAGIACPLIDGRMFQTYLAYFVHSGFLTAPPAR